MHKNEDQCLSHCIMFYISSDITLRFMWTLSITVYMYIHPNTYKNNIQYCLLLIYKCSGVSNLGRNVCQKVPYFDMVGFGWTLKSIFKICCYEFYRNY